VTGDTRIPAFIEGLPKTRAAFEYAARVHAGQRRAVDGAPFIVHPLEVASLLHDAGAPDDVVAAGMLHDSLEKGTAVPADLRRFGDRVARVVRAVTEDDRISGYSARKAALREQIAGAGADALLVLAADKISKVRELRTGPPRTHGRRRRATPGVTDRRRRLAHYRGCLRLLEERLPDAPLVLQLRTELDATAGAGVAGSALAAR
jgi:(p)ppGpp synthase/HD superfamily hydrolase